MPTPSPLAMLANGSSHSRPTSLAAPISRLPPSCLPRNPNEHGQTAKMPAAEAAPARTISPTRETRRILEENHRAFDSPADRGPVHRNIETPGIPEQSIRIDPYGVQMANVTRSFLLVERLSTSSGRTTSKDTDAPSGKQRNEPGILVSPGFSIASSFQTLMLPSPVNRTSAIPTTASSTPRPDRRKIPAPPVMGRANILGFVTSTVDTR